MLHLIHLDVLAVSVYTSTLFFFFFTHWIHQICLFRALHLHCSEVLICRILFSIHYRGTIFRLLLSGHVLTPIRVCLARFSKCQREAGGWQSFRSGRHAQPGYCQSLDFRPDESEASTESRRQWLPVYYARRRLIRSQRVRAILNKGRARSLVKEQQISDAFGAFSRGANQLTFTILFGLRQVSLSRTVLMTLALF